MAKQQDGQQSGQATGPLAGEPRRRPPPSDGQWHRRVVTWFTWWVLMMSLWVAVDDSFESDELLVGAGAAAVAALAAELATRQAEVRFRIRAAWLLRAFELPGQVVQHTFLVFAALAATLFAKTQATETQAPRGRFREVPVRYGDDSPLGVTRRVLLIAARSLAPNEFVLGMDADRDVMVTHQLVEER
jgi:multisubunit Na+/H+ antiporter MnhE subunit